MQMRLADYVAELLVANGITDCFTVTGGGAMHLNDALGHKKGLTCLYNHHEQASAMAAEAYARVHNRIAAVCVTSGPGGTNALTGVLGAWLDSIPMLVLSGQVRYAYTARAADPRLRALGDQEFDITRAASSMTKYAVMLEDPAEIRYVLEKAIWLAKNGRPGPTWVDIPLDFQGAMINPAALRGFDPTAESFQVCKASQETIKTVLERLKTAQRPLLYAGNAIRLSGAHPLFEGLVKALGIPVVTAWNAIDLIACDHPLYVGRAGIAGDRAGNFAVQNADVILSLGTRLSIRQVGYDAAGFAKNAFVMMVDIDRAELEKPTLHVELPICADVRDFAEELLKNCTDTPIWAANGWEKACLQWRCRYPVILPEYKAAKGLVNPYFFIGALSAALPADCVTVSGNGSACIMGSQAFVTKHGTRFLVNSGAASMGYDLPAAIGASVALGRGEVLCLTGDGSLQMNLQELQTILTNRLPIKIVVLNNGGYHSIRQSQGNHFASHTLVGVGPQSGDLEFPSLEKIVAAYGYPYLSCHENSAVSDTVAALISQKEACIAEIFVDPTQHFAPKSAARRLPDGSMVSSSLEDMAPFLSREELQEAMNLSNNISKEK